MIYRKTPAAVVEDNYLESFETFPGNVLELAIESERNDMRMFESLIELDFLEASIVREAEGEEASKQTAENAEIAKKSIIAKIKEIVDKAIQWVSNAFAKLLTNLSRIISGDKKFIDKYSEKFTAENLKDFVIPKYAPLIEWKEMKVSDLIGDAAVEACEAFEIGENYSKEKALQCYQDVINKLFGDKGVAGAFETFGKEEENYHLDGAQIKVIMDVIKEGKKNFADVKLVAKGVKTELEGLKKCNNVNKKIQKDNSEEIAVLNGEFAILNAAIKDVSVFVNAYTGAVSKRLSAARRVFISGVAFLNKQDKVAAKAAEAAKKGETNAAPETAEDKAVEEAVNWLMGECSDAYVESVMFA